MKVSEMNELANSQYRALNDLSHAASERCRQSYEENAADALREALARMEVLDDLKRLDKMDAEIKALRERVSENLEFTGFYRNAISLSNILEMGSRYDYMALPDSLLAEVVQVMSERGIKIARYTAPTPGEIVSRFKQCKTLTEIKQVMEGYQRDALTILAPVLGTATNTNQEGA